jgi:hypothetical protein
MGHIW